MPNGPPPLIEIQDLRTQFVTDDGLVTAVDGVSFTIPRGKTLGLVGESGCGKSVTGLSLLQLVPPPGRVAGGRILYYREAGGEPLDLAALSPRSDAMRAIRGNEIAMIFQEPMTSLNPVYTIGDQIAEAVMLHQGVRRRQARERAVEMLDRVGIASPRQRVDEYPHQLSGGMRQRAMIAMALACRSIPVIGSPRKERLTSIPGVVPSLLNLPAGCPFRPRCAERLPQCLEPPSLREVRPAHCVSCWLHSGPPASATAG